MQRILSAVSALAFALALGSGTAFATEKSKANSMGGMSMGTTCPTGTKLVKGYTTKSGKVIKPYCRKAKGKM